MRRGFEYACVRMCVCTYVCLCGSAGEGAYERKVR